MTATETAFRDGGLLPYGHARTVAVASLTTTIGRGLYLTGAALFLTRAAGFGIAEVGAGLTIAGIVALITTAPLGHLTDRCGPRGIAIALLITEAATRVAFIVTQTFLMFVAVASIAAIAEQGNRTARQVLAARIGGDDRVRFRAYLRAVSNIGISAGTLVAGIAITSDTHAGYILLMIANATTSALAALVLLRLPTFPPVPKPDGATRLSVLRNPRFGRVLLTNSIVHMQYKVVGLIMALWLVGHTDLPPWSVSAALVLNTVLVIGLQIPASRGISDAMTAARRIRASGVMFAGSCTGFALLAVTSGWHSWTLLVLTVTVHTVGEIWHAAGAFELPYALAPMYAHGQYQATFSLGTGITDAIAPLALTTLCLNGGTPGWIILGGILAIAAFAMPTALHPRGRHRTAHRAHRTHPVWHTGDRPALAGGPACSS